MEITYVGQSEGDYFALYHFLADGGRPVLEILVDPRNEIWIAGVGGFGVAVPQVTDGRAHRHTDEELAQVIGEENATQICLGSIYAYVTPRIVDLMGRVYCPNTKRANLPEHDMGGLG